MPERKHIAIEVIRADAGGGIIRIVEQTHRLCAFGRSDDLIGRFIATNGTILKSVDYPDWLPDDHTLFVRGQVPSGDERTLAIECGFLESIIEAVKEYNEYFSGDHPGTELPSIAGLKVERIG